MGTMTVQLPEPNLCAQRERWAVRISGQDGELVEVCAMSSQRVTLHGLHTSTLTVEEARELAVKLLAAVEATDRYQVKF